ncbi:hypothetical protein NL676_037182 [Syzygium grande]|nr:hypothetical protein NL676_037182 [Syzygium grande]
MSIHDLRSFVVDAEQQPSSDAEQQPLPEDLHFRKDCRLTVTSKTSIFTRTAASKTSTFMKTAEKIYGENLEEKLYIYINPHVAPPLVGGCGYGYGVPFYGGWGWSPFSFFARGPSVAVGGGFDVLAFFLILDAIAAVMREIHGISG